jgi:peptidoglycan hydrolase-like protein with peptidoglycan-binding domain
MRETRLRSSEGNSASAVGTRRHEPALDDWLGDVSDEDWSEDAAERAERRRGAPVYERLSADEAWVEPTDDRSWTDGPLDADEAHRAVIERRRLIAGLVVVVVLGLAVVIPVTLLRGGADEPVSSVSEPATATATTTPASTETTPSSTTTTPQTTTPSTTTPTTTTPSTSSEGFTLPEGTKLRRGEEADSAVVILLQQALSSAGYDPGSADGTYGLKTEAAVVAFQQDNGLSADGVVGAETASALNSALSKGATATETSPSTTTPSAPSGGFTLPEGTKLRRGEEADPAVVTALQQALSSAGYDPGSADGTYGQKTEAAVVAFQQDNGLSADGVVGPETASALSSALASG